MSFINFISLINLTKKLDNNWNSLVGNVDDKHQYNKDQNNDHYAPYDEEYYTVTI